jgi:DNA-binding transcriptional regulator YiaG
MVIGPFERPIDASRRLRMAGLSMREAYHAVTALAAGLPAMCEIPIDVDVADLARDLTAMNVSLRRRTAAPEPNSYLVDVRTRHNLTQRQLADHLGFDLRTLQNWEQGRNRPDPAILNLVRVFDRNPQIVADALFEPL